MSIPLLMPAAGLSFADVSKAALECGGNRVRTAKRLGVGIRSLAYAIRRENLDHWFNQGHGSGKKSRATCVSREQIVELAQEGYIRRDAAFLLGISPAYLKDLVAKWGLADDFTVRKGHAAVVSRLGYCN